MELDDEVCFCFHVSKRKLLNYLRVHRLRRASQLSECGGAGTGCGWCVAYLKKYFHDFETGRVTADEDITVAEYGQARQQYIADGGGTPPSGSV